MRRNVPCDFFGHNDFIYFDYGRLATLEGLIHGSIVSFIESGNAITLDFLAKAYYVGLQHCHAKADYMWYIKQFDEKGLSIQDLAAPVIKAILASGILGKGVADAAMGESETKND